MRQPTHSANTLPRATGVSVYALGFAVASPVLMLAGVILFGHSTESPATDSSMQAAFEIHTSAHCRKDAQTHTVQKALPQ
jgi:hypothetical protein